MSNLARILATELTPKSKNPKKGQSWVATKDWDDAFYGHDIKKGDVVTVKHINLSSNNAYGTDYIEVDLHAKDVPTPIMGLELDVFLDHFRTGRR